MSERAEEHLEEHFSDLGSQTHAARLGMWVFLATEVLFFGALFTLYAAYRATYPVGFREASGHTDLVLGSVMTYVLLAASFLVALAVGAVRDGRSRAASWLLWGATALGVAFLALKLTEYQDHFHHGLYPGRYLHSPDIGGPAAMAFFTLYYLMTGLHLLHVTGGVGILGWVAARAGRGAYGPRYHTPLELGGMYWHFVDVVWLFLWPAFYLMR